MYRFGTRSLSRIATVHGDLQKVLHRAMGYQIMDFTIICGHRDQAAQTEAYATGVSKVRWPNSNHNAMPSQAVDIAGWPIDWKDSLAFARLAGIIEAAAAEEGIKLRWGGDWNRDGRSTDQTFMDLGHLELYHP